MNQKIIALGDYCLIKKIGESDRLVDGIIITASQQSLLSKAEVLSIGDGKKLEKLHLKIGDICWYNEIESNCVAADGTSDQSYFVRWDLIFGKIIN